MPLAAICAGVMGVGGGAAVATGGGAGSATWTSAGIALSSAASAASFAGAMRAFQGSYGEAFIIAGLTGVIAALIAQNLDPFDAACLGVYAHGLAGDIARDQNGEVGLIAGDIVDSLADAFHHLSE